MAKPIAGGLSKNNWIDRFIIQRMQPQDEGRILCMYSPCHCLGVLYEVGYCLMESFSFSELLRVSR